MTNREKYKEKLLDIIESGSAIAIVKGKPIKCRTLYECDECDLFDGSVCEYSNKLKEWMQSEYKEPEVDWSKVPIDTKILVGHSKDSGVIKRHFARYEYGKVFAFDGGNTSFTAISGAVTPWGFAKLAEVEDEKP